jgi:hypothetical protein
MHVKLAVSAVVLAAVLLGGATHAMADRARTALLVWGTTTSHARTLATTTIEAAARNTGVPFANQTFSPGEEATLKACATVPQAWTCIAPMIRDKGLDQVALVSLVMSTSSDGSPMIVLTAQIIVAKLDAVVGAQRFCTHCSDDLLVESASELTRAVLEEIRVRSGRSVVTVHSTPRGARITLDGAPAGATDRSLSTVPGTHMVVLELEGYQREARAIDAVVDRTIELSVAMRPTPGRLDEPRDPFADRVAPRDPLRGARLATMLASGFGGLAMIAGAVVLVFDQDPVTQPIGTEQPARYRDTLAPGLGLLLSGAALGAGGLLWWQYRRSTMAPAVAPIAGGAVIGVTNAF